MIWHGMTQGQNIHIFNKSSTNNHIQYNSKDTWKRNQSKVFVTERSSGSMLGQKIAEQLNILTVGPPEDFKHLPVNYINQDKHIERTIHPMIE